MTTTTVPSAGSVITAAGGAQIANGICPSDDPYFKQLVINYSKTFGALYDVAAANPYAKTDNSSGLFLGVVIVTTCSIQAVSDIGAGKNISGSDCLAANKQVAYTIGQATIHQNDVVPLPLTGENYYQDLFQQLARVQGAYRAIDVPCADVTGGPWLQLIKGRNAAVDAFIQVTNNNDSTDMCVEVTAGLKAGNETIKQCITSC